MRTLWHRALQVAQSGGGGGGAGGGVDENLVLINALPNGTEVAVEDGDVLYAITAFRDSGTTSASAPSQSLLNQTDSWTAIVASTRFDTGGVSDGAAAFWKCDIDVTETVTFSESRACILLHDKGGRYTKLTTPQSPTDTAAAQGGTTSPAVTLAAADYASATYALFVCGYNDDVRSTGEQDTTADFTLPSEILDFMAVGSTASGYDEDVFIGYAAPPAEDSTYTFTHVNAATMFAAGGWRIWVFPFTLA